MAIISGGGGLGYVIGDFSEVRDPKHAGASRAICDADANHFGGVSLSSSGKSNASACCDYFALFEGDVLSLDIFVQPPGFFKYELSLIIQYK